MFKNLLAGFIILALAIALILYAYGRKVVSNMTSPSTEAYVDKTTDLSNGNAWSEYSPPSKKFTARFPTNPQHAVDRSTDAKTQEKKQYEMYISETDGKVFMISVISFLNSKQIGEDEKILRNIVEDMVSSNSSNKLDHIEYGNFENHKDADFVITNPSFAIAGRAFVDNNQLYVLSALTKTPEESKTEFNHFVQTFKLNKSVAPSTAEEK